MLYYTSTHADVAESFLLGLSCLVGGDQFFILVSKTDASPKTQSYIAITTVLSTLFLAFVFYDQYNRSLFDVTHVLYIVLLVIWGLFLYQNVRNPFVTTYYISILAMVMTFLVIISCVHYSHQKELLPSFLSGMLCARLLPTILWIFVHQKKAESKSNLSSLSARLALFRLVFCIISMILKFTSGNLDFSLIKMDTVEKYDWYVIRPYAFKNIWEYFKNMFEHFKKSSDHIYSILYIIVLITSSLFLFIFAIVLYLALPPIVNNLSHLYSHHLYSRIDIVKTLSHILGVALGTKYPASKTVNSHYFPNIFLGYGVYFFGSPIVNNRYRFTSQLFLYTNVILNGLILGYIWAYSLAIIINTLFNPTCLYEEQPGLIPCCGDKSESQCYCKLPSIIEKLNKKLRLCYPFLDLSPVQFTYGVTCKYLNRFSCSKSFEHRNKLRESFNYHPNGPNAILLSFNETDCSSITSSNGCSDVCKNPLCYCFNLFGIYKIQSVTTSTCENCQLTIRIEAKSTCCSNGSDSTGSCHCNSGEKKCCCLAIKGCDQSGCSSNGCCCVKLCNCSQDSCSCNCKLKSKINMTRLFICFKKDTKCCIKEIRINYTPFFDSDLTIQNQFYIKSIDFSDCCHVDLKVDLHCIMKNNFFRLTPINYPKKTIKPVDIILSVDDSECSEQSSSTCRCLENLAFSKVMLQYEHGVDLTKACPYPKNCNSVCSNCQNKECCNIRCIVFCTSQMSSFNYRINPVRVKLVIILWFLFLLSLIIAITSESKDKTKKLKYYQFFPIRSFEAVNEEVQSNGMNSMNQVLERLKSVQQHIFLELFGEKDKKTDLDHILQLCMCAFDPRSLNRLRHYVLSKSSMLIASPQYMNRRLNLELVKWSYCVGFVYTYIMLMFFRIQEYFLKWELVWEREYMNYTRIMKKKFNNLTNKSKSSMSLMCEKGVDHKTTLYTDTSKKGNWDCSNFEMDIHANLNERETEMNKDPPYRLDLRLMFYLDKWKHRVENLKFWTQNETNVYDWTGFLKEYPGIRTWFFKFLPHIQAASHQLNIPMEKIKIGTGIPESKTLNLIS